MSNERPTKEITLASGKVFVVNTYITGREKRSINEVMLRDIEMKQQGGQQEITGFKGDSTFEMENRTIQAVVHEIRSDGATITDKKQIVDYVLDMPQSEYDAVIDIVNDVSNPKAEPTS
jgi:hypothetical protein